MSRRRANNERLRATFESDQLGAAVDAGKVSRTFRAFGDLPFAWSDGSLVPALMAPGIETLTQTAATYGDNFRTCGCPNPDHLIWDPTIEPQRLLCPDCAERLFEWFSYACSFGLRRPLCAGCGADLGLCQLLGIGVDSLDGQRILVRGLYCRECVVVNAVSEGVW